MTPARHISVLGHAARVLEGIQREGYSVISEPIDDQTFVELGCALGEIVDDVIVKIVPGERAYLARRDPMPFHTDHPIADIVAWRCESQDERDGASLLVDGYAALEALGARLRSRLERIRLVPPSPSDGEVEPTPILSADHKRIFFAPWLRPIDASREALLTLAAFREVIEQAPHALERRLGPGQALFIDNHRMMHGRDALSSDSTRKLRRLWLHNPGSAATEVGVLEQP